MNYSAIRFICIVLCFVCTAAFAVSFYQEAQETLTGLPGMAAFATLGMAAAVNMLRSCQLQYGGGRVR